jgi:hypothetical protein
VEEFTEEYFKQELNNFINLSSSKQFWELSEEQRAAAIQGLTHIYFEANLPDKYESLFRAALINYQMRKLWMDKKRAVLSK